MKKNLSLVTNKRI